MDVTLCAEDDFTYRGREAREASYRDPRNDMYEREPRMEMFDREGRKEMYERDMYDRDPRKDM